MIHQGIPGLEHRPVHLGSGYETPALRHSDDLLDLIHSGKLSPDGTAAAQAGRGLIYAVLLLGETVAAAGGDTAGAVTGLDATLGIIAGAVTDTAAGPGTDGSLAEETPAGLSAATRPALAPVNTECCPAAPGHADRADEHLAGLRKLLDSKELSPDGQATAHGALSVASAILALRGSIIDAIAELRADAADGLDAVLGILAGPAAGTSR